MLFMWVAPFPFFLYSFTMHLPKSLFCLFLFFFNHLYIVSGSDLVPRPDMGLTHICGLVPSSTSNGKILED